MNNLRINIGNGNYKEFNFYTFTKYILGYNKLDEVHKSWCEEADTFHKRKLFLKPRGTYKSTVYTVAYVIWKLIQNPNERILIANATSENAEAFLREIRSHFIRNERFIQLFGKIVDERDAKVSSITLNNRNTFSKEASISTVGVLGNLVSAHYSTIIADDLCNDKDRESETIREKKKKWFQDLMSVLDPNGEIVVVGTVWHFEDLYSFIEKKLDPLLKPSEKWFIKKESCYLEDEKTPRFPTVLPTEVLERLKIEKGVLEFSCTPKETPILMFDWTLKPISEIKEGEFIMGWEDVFDGKGKFSKLKPSKVLNTFSKEDNVFNLIMESGKIIRCTKDHKWYTGKHSKDKQLYTPPRRGKYLHRIFPILPTDISLQEQKDWSYLAGIIDGEGSFKSSSSITLSQCHIKNPDVYNKIIEVLNRLNIDYGEYKRIHINKKWSNSKFIWLKNSRDIYFKLLVYTDIGKRNQIINSIYKYGTRFIINRDKIIDIVFDKKEIVYALKTETGNYVAWGYGSSNSQYINKALPTESQIFFENDFKTFEYLGTNRVLDNGIIKTVDFVGYCDLSIGKSKSSDFTAIVTLGKSSDGCVYIIDASVERQPPDRTLEMIFIKHKIFDYKFFGIESNVFQSLFAENVKKMSLERQVYLPVVEVGHTANKHLRIQSLQPIVKQGILKIRYDWKDDASYKEGMNQFIFFPLAGHDDFPDAIEGAFSLFKKTGKFKGKPLFASTKPQIDISGFDYQMDMNKFNIDINSPEKQQLINPITGF